MMLIEQIRHDIDKFERRGLGSLADVQLLTNLLLSEKCLEERNKEQTVEVVNDSAKAVAVPVEVVVQQKSNGKFDRNINQLYDDYMESRILYENDCSDKNKGSMIEALEKLMVEIHDLVSALHEYAIFGEERAVIKDFSEKLCDKSMTNS